MPSGQGKRFRFGGLNRIVGRNYVPFSDLFVRSLRIKSGEVVGAFEPNPALNLEGVEYRKSPTTGRKKPIKPKPRRVP